MPSLPHLAMVEAGRDNVKLLTGCIHEFKDLMISLSYYSILILYINGISWIVMSLNLIFYSTPSKRYCVGLQFIKLKKKSRWERL